jgi:hypothetical protein
VKGLLAAGPMGAFLLFGAVMNRRKRRIEASGVTMIFCD